jgi:HEAT repeat protein
LNDRRQIAEFIAYLKADGKPVVRAIARQGAPPENLAGAIFSREPAWVEVLLELAHDPDRIIGDAALKLLGVSRNPYAQKALIEALEHPDAPVRLGAVRACAVRNTINQGDTVFAEALAKRLAEEHPALRRAAAIALGQLGDKRAVAPLIEAARTERNTPDALRIWSLLSLFDDPMAAEALIELLRDPNNSQREQALYALNASTNPKVAEAMREMAADEKSPVGLRAAAAMQLCRSGIKDQKVLDILCAVLNDPALDRDCRVYVVGALRTLDDPKVGEALLACIRNKGLDLDVREDIVSLLNARELGADVIKKFIVLLDNEEVPEGIRARVAAMLVVDKSRRGRAVTRSGETDPRVRQALLTLQKSNNLSPHTRRSLMEALVYAGDPTTLQAVYDRIPGAELKMKLHLATALCIAFRDEKAIEPLLDVLKYGEQQDRRNATYALMAYSRSENIHVDVKQKIDAALDEYRKTKNLPVRPPQPPPEEF